MTAFPQFAEGDQDFDSIAYLTERDLLTASFENNLLFTSNTAGGLFFYDSAGLNIGFGFNITGNINTARADLLAAGLSFTNAQWKLIEAAALVGSAGYTPHNAGVLNAAVGVSINLSQAYTLMNNFYDNNIGPALDDTFSDDGITPGTSFSNSVTSAGMADEFYNTYKGTSPVAAFGESASGDFASGDIGGVAFETAFRLNSANSAGLETRRLAEAFMELGGTFGFNAASFGAGPDGITSISFGDALTSDLVSFAQYVAVNTDLVAGGLYSATNVDSYNLGFNQLMSTLLSRGYYVPQSATISWDSSTSQAVATSETETWSSIISSRSLSVGGSSPATTLQNLNSVFDDSNISAGGLVHVPVGSYVTVGTSPAGLAPIPVGENYVFDTASQTLYTMGTNLDGTHGGALIIDTPTPGTTGYPTFDKGTYTGVTYDASTNTVGVDLSMKIGIGDYSTLILGTYSINETTGHSSFTFSNGFVQDLTGINNLHITDPLATPENIVIDYLSELGDSTSAPDLSIANNSYYNPSGTAYGVSGVVVANPGNTSATEYFAPGNTPGATLTGVDEADILVGGVEVEVPTSDVLETDVLGTPNVTDIASDTLDDVKTLDLGGPLTLTVGQFNAFKTIEGSGSLTIATDGMGSALTNVVDISNCSQDAPNVTAAINTISVQGWDGVTVVGNNTDGQTLIASLYGDDTLEAGDGAADTLYAGEGMDTLVGGTGGDTFYALNGLADGSIIQGKGTDDVGYGATTLYAIGDISQADVTGIDTLEGGNITLNATQFSEFTTVNAVSITAASGGTYDAVGVTLMGGGGYSEGIAMDAASSQSTTLVAPDYDAGDPTFTASGLTASGDGNDTLEAGGANEDTLNVTGNGNNTVSATDGINDSITVSGNGNNSLTLGNGAGDSIIISGNGNNNVTVGYGAADSVLISGTGNNDITVGAGNGDVISIDSGTGTLTVCGGADDVISVNTTGYALNITSGAGDEIIAQGGGDTITGGDGDESFSVYGDDNTITGGDGDDTIDLMGASDGSGGAVDLAGSVINGGSGTNTLSVDAEDLDISSATVSNVQIINNAETLTLTATQMSSLTSLNVSTLDAATSGTYSLSGLTTDKVDMADVTSTGGVTLIGNNANDETLTGGAAGGDTLEAGNGSGDTLVAGKGVNTLIGGTGGDTFKALSGLAPGSTVTGHGTGNTLEATGDISGATISGIQTLDLVGSVELTSAQYAEFTTVDGTGSYTIVGAAITAASAASLAGTTGFTAVNVIDSAANVQSNLDDLQTLAGDSELASVTFTDDTAPTFTLTAAQLASDSGALAAIAGTYYLAVTGVTAANAASVAAQTNVISIAVSDTAANVTSNITALEALAAAGSLTSIAFTDSGTPALTFSATDAASNIDAIATFTGAFTLAVSDTAANVATNIDALGEIAAIGNVTSITLTDSGTPTLDLSATQVGNDAAALALITSAFTVAVSDTGDNVAANLDALQALANSSLLSSITLTDSTTPTLSITETQLSDDSGALAAIGSTYDLAVSNVMAADAATVAATTDVTSVSITDTAANVEANLSALETLAAADTLTSIFFTDTDVPTLSVTEAQLTSDAPALALIAGVYDLAVTSVAASDAATIAATAGVTTVSISDTAANVVANLDELQALAAAGELGTITLTDSGTPTLSLSQAQLAIDADAIAAITGSYDISPSSVLAGSAATVAAETGVTFVAVSDTAANVAANLDALETLAADSELASITLINTGIPTLTITGAQFASDGTALGLISGSYDLAVTSVLAASATTVAANTHVILISVSDSAANVASNIDSLQTVATGGLLSAVTLTDGGTPTLTITSTQFSSDTGALGDITSAYHLAVTGVTAANAATVGANSHVTSITISDTAANVVTNLAALQTLSTKLTSISLTDSGTPTLSITYSQLTGDATALGKISGSYNLAVSAVSAANAATVAAESHVTSVSVSDTAANVVTNLASLETLATAATLASIILTNGGTPAVTVSYTQLTGDATALGLITSAHTLAVTSVSAANAATVAGETYVTSVSVSDSSANVVTNLNSLQTVTSEVTLSIALTDGGTPTLTITGTQFSNDGGALGDISSAYHLAVTSVLAANASTVGANSHVTSITISDTAADVGTNIAALESLGTKLTSITLTDSGTPVLTLTYTQLIDDATALGKISGSYDITVTGVTAANAATAAGKANVTSIEVSDTAANVITNLASLETLATAGTLASIALTNGGTPTLTVTYTQFSGDAGALSLITSGYDLAVTAVTAAGAATVAANSHVTSISVSDTSANIATNINSLESVAGVLTAIAATDGGSQTITITAAQANNDYGALSQLTGSYKIGVTDTAANISANMDALQTLYAFATHNLTITASDGASNNVIITAAQAGNDSGAISASSGSFHVEVRDSAANIAADFGNLQSLVNVSKLTDVVFTDSGTPTLALTYVQYSSGTAPYIFNDISGSYNLTVSAVPYADLSAVTSHAHFSSATLSDTAATISTNLNTLQTSYAATGKLTGVTVTNGSTASVTMTYAQLSSDATVLGLFTGTYSFKVNLVTVANAATVLAIPHVASISISDTAANVIAGINTLETYAAASQLYGIVLTDGGAPAMTATATQGASDATAFGLISSAFHLTINDTAANVQANLDGLQALYAAIGTSDFTAITLTDGTEPTLTISASQATNDVNAINKITSAYHLTVSDTAANVVANLTGLETLNAKLTSIVLTDGGTPNLSITGTQYTADITAINKITSAYTLTVSGVTGANVSTVAANTHVSSFTVSDTAANISTYIDTLQAQSAKITSISITNHTVPLTITQTQLTNDATALGLISVSYSLSISGVSIANSSTMLAEPNVVSINISDTAANVQSNLDSLETLDAAGEITGIVLTDTGTPTITITAAQATSDKTAILDITSIHNLVVNDTSANVLADMAGLIALGAHLTTITLTDGGTPNFAITGTQYSADSTTLSKITSAYTMTVSAASASQGNTVGANTHVTSYAIVDSVSSVAADLGLIEPHTSTLSSITLTDSGTPTLSITGSVLNSDAAAIAKIASTYDETVTATANTTQTLTGTGSLNTVSFTGESQGVTANLSTGSATTVHSGTTYTTTLSGFENVTGSAYADTLTAGSSGSILTGDGGADTYVLNASSGYDIAQDTATHLNGTTIQNFSVLDGIDLTNITNSGSTTLGFVENGGGTQGTLTVSDGTHTAALTLLGNYTTASFQDVSDGASGTLVAMASTTHLSAILAAAQA
jgi:hypothetical protein